MKISEISNKSENLIETGNQLDQQLSLSRNRLASAQGELIRAQVMLETELRNRDGEDATRDIRIESTKELMNQARVKVALAQSEVSRINQAINETNVEKQKIVQEFDNHNTVKQGNLDQLNRLGGKRFGNNVNGMLADVIDKMNLAEKEKVRLLKSMGINATSKVYSGVASGPFQQARNKSVAGAFDTYKETLINRMYDFEETLSNTVASTNHVKVKSLYKVSGNRSNNPQEKADKIQVLNKAFIEESHALIEEIEGSSDLSREEKKDLLTASKSLIQRCDDLTSEALLDLAEGMEQGAEDSLESSKQAKGTYHISNAIDGFSENYRNILTQRHSASDEHVKKVFDRHFDKLVIFDSDFYDTPVYQPSPVPGQAGGIKFNAKVDQSNVRGAGTAFYHEVGHMIDASLTGFKGMRSDTDTFRNALLKDSKDLVDLYDEMPFPQKMKFREILRSNQLHSVSDLLEGTQNKSLSGGWGHGPEYWERNHTNLSAEAFAHFFEASMGGGYKKEMIENIFPSSYELFSEMIDEDNNKV